METFEFLVTSTVQAFCITITAHESWTQFYQDMQKRDTTVVTRCNN